MNLLNGSASNVCIIRLSRVQPTPPSQTTSLFFPTSPHPSLHSICLMSTDSKTILLCFLPPFSLWTRRSHCSHVHPISTPPLYEAVFSLSYSFSCFQTTYSSTCSHFPLLIFPIFYLFPFSTTSASLTVWQELRVKYIIGTCDASCLETSLVNFKGYSGHMVTERSSIDG